jgi:hypothetical protein
MHAFNTVTRRSQLRLAGEVNGADHLRGALDVNLTGEIVAEDGWIAKRQCALHQTFVTLTFVGQLLQQVLANRFQRPAGIVAIQEVRGGVELLLREAAAGTQDFVARVTEMSTTTTRPSGKSHIRAWSSTVLPIGGDTMIPKPLETSAKTCPARSVISAALVGAPISRRIQSLSTVLMVA